MFELVQRGQKDGFGRGVRGGKSAKGEILVDERSENVHDRPVQVHARSVSAHADLLDRKMTLLTEIPHDDPTLHVCLVLELKES